jgi:hypothetical protein
MVALAARTGKRRSGDCDELAATYRFDSPGGCHIQKVSGPDTLLLP